MALATGLVGERAGDEAFPTPVAPTNDVVVFCAQRAIVNTRIGRT
jgi:hypothetical protein